MDQSPPGGVYTKNGSSVSLVISQGAPPASAVDVPDVLGQGQQAATQALQAAGFKVEVVQLYSSSVPQGDVGAQAPSGGAQSPPGATVTIAVSLGPTPAPPTTEPSAAPPATDGTPSTT